MMLIKKPSSGISAAVNVILHVYLVFLGLVFPLYIGGGYYMLGFEKFLIWRTVSLTALGAVLFKASQARAIQYRQYNTG